MNSDVDASAMMQEAAAGTGALKPGAGTRYRSVQRMLEQGLVTQITWRSSRHADDERRRYYRVTPFGRSVAKAEMRRLAQMRELGRGSGFAPEKG